jgi:guanine nucleotide-binding protein G(I)/G(S)/G(T) subunit beta-1
MNPTAIFCDHSADVMSVSVDTNSGMFASGSCDGTVKLWDYREKRNCVQTFIGHESDVNSVQFFPDGNAIAGGSDDTSCRLFDKRSCSQLSVYSDPKLLCGITSVAFSNSGRILFAGCDDRSCLAWDTLKGSLTTMLNAHENRVSCIGTTNDGKALATGSWDFEMRIWA